MRGPILSTIDRIKNLIEYPELIGTITRGVNRTFVRDLLFLKKKLRISPATILDVGAAVGEFTRAARFVFPSSTVLAFEPLPESVKILRDLQLRDPMIQIFPFALGSKNQETPFFQNEFSFSSSLLPMTSRHKEEFPFTREEQIITVQCRRLDAVEGADIAHPAFMKIDVQGAEQHVLTGTGSLMSRFEAVLLETNFENFYSGQAGYDDLFKAMKELGFSRFLQRNPVFSETTDDLVFSDILFYR